MKEKLIHKDKPALFDLSHEGDVKEFRKLEQKGMIQHKVDDYESELRELYAVDNPQDYFKPTFKKECDEFVKNISKEGSLRSHGMWVYFPWSSTSVHILR